MEGDNNTINDMYKECLRNHAASLGSYATDGCGEFTLDDTTSGGGGLNCAACGCHRNFHRKLNHGRAHHEITPEIIEGNTGGSRQQMAAMAYSPENSSDHRTISGKKRFRTKFSEEQKEKMMGFAEKLGWNLQRRDLEDDIERFCRGIGISRKVFKVWMHNHKNTGGNASSLTDQ